MSDHSTFAFELSDEEARTAKKIRASYGVTNSGDIPSPAAIDEFLHQHIKLGSREYGGVTDKVMHRVLCDAARCGNLKAALLITENTDLGLTPGLWELLAEHQLRYGYEDQMEKLMKRSENIDVGDFARRMVDKAIEQECAPMRQRADALLKQVGERLFRKKQLEAVE